MAEMLIATSLMSSVCLLAVTAISWSASRDPESRTPDDAPTASAPTKTASSSAKARLAALTRQLVTWQSLCCPRAIDSSDSPWGQAFVKPCRRHYLVKASSVSGYPLCGRQSRGRGSLLDIDLPGFCPAVYPRRQQRRTPLTTMDCLSRTRHLFHQVGTLDAHLSTVPEQ